MTWHMHAVKVTQKQKMEKFCSLPNKKDLLGKNRVSHFPPFYNEFSYRNLTLKIGYFILW